MNDNTLEIGAILRTRAWVTYTHYGIWTGCGVIHNSKERGQVEETSLEEFHSGNGWRIDSNIIGPLTGQEVVNRARAKLGTQYRLTSWNCENFARYAVGLEPQSAQVQMTVLVGVAFLLLRAARR